MLGGGGGKARAAGARAPASRAPYPASCTWSSARPAPRPGPPIPGGTQRQQREPRVLSAPSSWGAEAAASRNPQAGEAGERGAGRSRDQSGAGVEPGGREQQAAGLSPCRRLCRRAAGPGEQTAEEARVCECASRLRLPRLSAGRKWLFLRLFLESWRA